MVRARLEIRPGSRMSFEPEAELDESDWEPRPVVLPVFKIPTRLAVPVAWGLVASAALSIIAGLVGAVSYRRVIPQVGFLGPGIHISEPSVGFADRVSLFVTGAANLTVAFVVVVAVVLVAMAVRQDDGENALTRSLALLITATVIASIVVLANVAQAIVILSNANGQFTAQYSANKAASILALLPPALSAAAALTYAAARLRSSHQPIGQADG